MFQQGHARSVFKGSGTSAAQISYMCPQSNQILHGDKQRRRNFLQYTTTTTRSILTKALVTQMLMRDLICLCGI